MDPVSHQVARTTPDRPAPKVRAVDHSVHTSPFHCGNSIDSWGFLSERLTVPKRRFRMPVTPNTAMGTGTGWNRHRGGRVTARNPRRSRPWGRPGEVFGEDCSQADPERGRRVGRRHNGVKAGGAGPGREARTGSNGQDAYWARYRPGAPPPPGGRGSRSGTGNGVPGPTGRSGAVGHRNGGTVGLSPDGGSWLSQVRSAGRRVGGTGSERSPSGHRSQGRSPERVADRVAVGRRNGSEELTGSPGGYSGPLSRFSGSRGPYGT